MITAKTLLTGNALSFREQPFVADLFQAVAQGDQRITLVVGAGVSMDAGLPSWPELLKRMADQLPPDMAKMAKSDNSDPMRKADHIAQLIDSCTKKKKIEAIRDALFTEGGDVPPGELADAIARLVSVDPSRFSVLTTNFDEVLEAALEVRLGNRPLSVGLDGPDPELAPGEFLVRHLHGLIRTNDKVSLEPVVLTESEFLKHGPAVRKIIHSHLNDSLVIFVGVSLTDPNLVGPLWDTVHEPSRHEVPDLSDLNQTRYVLVVPTHEPGSNSLEESYEYSVNKATYLHKRLAARPLFLKSFSQLVQLLSDLALATAEPARYRARVSRGEQSTRYGKRFHRALTDAYDQLGCSPRTDVLAQAAGDNLSEALFTGLNSRQGPISILRRIGRELGNDAPHKDENFGLFLWLRVRAHGDQSSFYGIRLLGSSASTYRESWLMPPPDRISPFSETLAAQCLFKGTTLLSDYPPGHRSVWRSIVATPITIFGYDSEAAVRGGKVVPLDRLTIGAVTMNSTFSLTEDSRGYSSVLTEVERIGELVLIANAMQDVAIKHLYPA